MTKMEFVIKWAKEDDSLTTYWGHGKVVMWKDMYYPNSKEATAVANLRYYINKLVKSGHLCTRSYVGLGFGARQLFFGTRVQNYWMVNKDKFSKL